MKQLKTSEENEIMIITLINMTFNKMLVEKIGGLGPWPKEKTNIQIYRKMLVFMIAEPRQEVTEAKCC